MLSTASSASLVVMVDDGPSKVSVMKPKTMTMATMMVRVQAMMRATGDAFKNDDGNDEWRCSWWLDLATVLAEVITIRNTAATAAAEEARATAWATSTKYCLGTVAATNAAAPSVSAGVGVGVSLVLVLVLVLVVVVVVVALCTQAWCPYQLGRRSPCLTQHPLVPPGSNNTQDP